MARGVVSTALEHLLAHSPYVSTRDVAEAAGVSRQAAHKQLKALVAAGSLVVEGRARAARYRRVGHPAADVGALLRAPLKNAVPAAVPAVTAQTPAPSSPRLPLPARPTRPSLRPPPKPGERLGLRMGAAVDGSGTRSAHTAVGAFASAWQTLAGGTFSSGSASGAHSAQQPPPSAMAPAAGVSPRPVAVHHFTRRAVDAGALPTVDVAGYLALAAGVFAQSRRRPAAAPDEADPAIDLAAWEQTVPQPDHSHRAHPREVDVPSWRVFGTGFWRPVRSSSPRPAVVPPRASRPTADRPGRYVSQVALRPSPPQPTAALAQPIVNPSVNLLLRAATVATPAPVLPTPPAPARAARASTWEATRSWSDVGVAAPQPFSSTLADVVARPFLFELDSPPPKAVRAAPTAPAPQASSAAMKLRLLTLLLETQSTGEPAPRPTVPQYPPFRAQLPVGPPAQVAAQTSTVPMPAVDVVVAPAPLATAVGEDGASSVEAAPVLVERRAYPRASLHLSLANPESLRWPAPDGQAPEATALLGAVDDAEEGDLELPDSVETAGETSTPPLVGLEPTLLFEPPRAAQTPSGARETAPSLSLSLLSRPVAEADDAAERFAHALWQTADAPRPPRPTAPDSPLSAARGRPPAAADAHTLGGLFIEVVDDSAEAAAPPSKPAGATVIAGSGWEPLAPMLSGGCREERLTIAEPSPLALVDDSAPPPLKQVLEVASAGALYRLSARALLAQARAKEVVLDFSGVMAVSDEFLDEVVRQWAPCHPDTALRVANVPTFVEHRVRAVFRS